MQTCFGQLRLSRSAGPSKGISILYLCFDKPSCEFQQMTLAATSKTTILINSRNRNKASSSDPISVDVCLQRALSSTNAKSVFFHDWYWPIRKLIHMEPTNRIEPVKIPHMRKYLCEKRTLLWQNCIRSLITCLVNQVEGVALSCTVLCD